MKARVYDKHFTGGWILVEIPFKSWLKLALLGEAYLKHDMKPRWRGKLPFHIVRCIRHGYFPDCPQGWEERFYCPLCDKEPPTYQLKLGVSALLRQISR